MQNNYVRYFRSLVGATDETISKQRDYDNQVIAHVQANGNKYCADNCEPCGTHFEAMRDAEGR